MQYKGYEIVATGSETIPYAVYENGALVGMGDTMEEIIADIEAGVYDMCKWMC